jgi:ABC-type amino acid transport substrate-binding protein
MKVPSILLRALLLAALTASAHAGPTLDRIRSSGRITIAHRESSVPLSYVDAEKKPIGYAVDLCLRLADAVKAKLALPRLEIGYVMVTGADRIPAIVEGRADLECGSTTNNAERRTKVAFTVPHYIAGARYLVRADSGIEQLADFEHKKLASTKNTTPLKAIIAANRDRLMGIEIVEVPDHEAAVKLVESKQVDGFAMDDVLLYGLRASRSDPTQLKVVGKFLTVEPLAIMLSKDDAELKRIVDDEMKRLITSRQIYPIYDRWFMQPIPPKKIALGLPVNYLLKDFWKYPSDWVPN